MADYKKFFKDKKITVMGLGLLGRGVGDALYAAECGAEVVVTDLKSEAELESSIGQFGEFPNVSFVLGQHRMEDFDASSGVDLVLVAAGVPADSPYLAHARETGVQLAQSAALFAELSGVPVIGVTGTRGKSTVTQMIHHTLTFATGEDIILGGNVRGVSNLQLLKEVHEHSIAVMELDSWQLQGFGWAEISPQIAVFTNFMPDHMNYYHDDMDAYFADKANIFLYQEESGTFITTPAVFDQAKQFAKGKNLTLGQEVVLADASVLPEDCLLAMPGEHNRLNAALAYEALKAVNVPDELIFEGLTTFPGIEGRLQFITEIDIPADRAGGVKVYNDNNATTPQATIAALRALSADGSEQQHIILILGGSDKGLDTTELISIISDVCKKVVLLPGTGSDALEPKLQGRIKYEKVSSLDEAVNAARAASAPEDIILFSPAFASFGLFVNEYDRNDQFLQIIQSIESAV